MVFGPRRILVAIFLTGLFSFSFSWVSPSWANNLLFVGDFEKGDLTGFFWNQNKPGVVRSPHPVRSGRYSMRSYLHRYESKYSYRTMVQTGSKETNPEGLRESFSMAMGGEYWVGLSIFVPPDFVPDGGGCGELWFQFQAVPDPGELWRSPVLAINVPQDKYRIKRMWDTRKFSPGMSFEDSELLYNESVLSDRGGWVDWVFHVKWSWQSNGLIEIWKDGIQIASAAGPNCSNDNEGPRISFGVYKWPWKEGKPAATHCFSSIVDRLIYVDEFRIGGANSSYDDVAPGGKPPLPQPSLSLFQGWNKITWPNVSNYTAKSALEGINAACSSKTGKVVARKSKGFWQDYVTGFGGENFNLQNSQNYFIKVNRACSWIP